MLGIFLKGKKKIIISIIVLLALVAGAFVFAFGGNGNGQEIVEVKRRDLIESVNISGEVKPKTTSNLRFDASGPISSILVEEGQRVSKGQVLARLDQGTLPAELRSAEADVLIKRASTENTTINIDAIKKKQDSLVENAHRKLLSSDLTAEPVRDSITLTSPTISGDYSGEEGRYYFEVRPANIEGKFDLYVSGIEEVGPVRMSENKSAPLGSKGLFVSLSTNPRTYSGIEWFVDIPNKEGSSYSINLSNYRQALRERERAIEEAQSETREQNGGASVSEAEVEKALAEVDRIKTLMSKRVIRAPYDGTISSIEISPGEIANSTEPAITMISSEKMAVEIDLPEVDYTKVSIGDRVEITFDALGDDFVVPGEVSFIKNVETIQEGVSYYEAHISFDEIPEEITSGMTADVVITTDERNDVLSLPSRAIKYRNNGQTYVHLSNGDGVREVDVELGMRSTDGYFEIIAGLNDGDKVLVKNSQ